MFSRLSESGENDEKFQELCELLVAGGYFRARISGLSAFDKIAGGLAWAIQSSREAIDVEFVEDSQIKDKIKVSENIEAALRNMKFNGSLQAHQIQGLDYPSLFPVLQWLLQKVIATREEDARQTREYARLVFKRTFGELPEEEAEEIATRDIPGRAFRRKAAEEFASEEDHVLSVLLEFGQKDQLAQEKLEEQLEASAGDEDKKRKVSEQDRAKMAEVGEVQLDSLMQDLAAHKGLARLSTAAASGLVQSDTTLSSAASEYEQKAAQLKAEIEKEEETKHQTERLKQKIEGLEEEVAAQAAILEKANKKKTTVLENLEKAEAVCSKAERKNTRIKQAIDEVGGELDDKRKATLKKLEGILQQVEDKKKEKEETTVKCQKELEDWQEKIASAKNEKPVKENEYWKQVEQEYAEEKKKTDKLMARVAKKNREISQIERQIDEIPTRMELLQYERRFTELYDQVRWKFEETKQYYNRYNTLSETVTFLRREMDLLDNIHENFDRAMGSKGREEFPGNIEKIVAAVNQNLEKVKKQLDAEQVAHDALSEKCTALLQKQRAYYSAVKEFQEECNKNEVLIGKIEKKKGAA
eukprot:TRINITY_DN67839_c5_g1_i1.p1 TRINITY_DN67839_c5_g1~~TRINITY_DN67839_c5_g1_i1.p1  ORF type:complete len:586 (-),score=137.89 TRINITY_DN67839_c5_g1_i1:1434-3191(-)